MCVCHQGGGAGTLANFSSWVLVHPRGGTDPSQAAGTRQEDVQAPGTRSPQWSLAQTAFAGPVGAAQAAVSGSRRHLLIIWEEFFC